MKVEFLMTFAGDAVLIGLTSGSTLSGILHEYNSAIIKLESAEETCYILATDISYLKTFGDNQVYELKRTA